MFFRENCVPVPVIANRLGAEVAKNVRLRLPLKKILLRPLCHYGINPARCRKLLVLQYTDNCTRILRVCPRTATSTKTQFSTCNKQVQMILVGLNKNQELDNRLLFLIVDYLAFLVDFLVVPVVVFFAPPAFLLGTLKSGSSASSPAINDGL